MIDEFSLGKNIGLQEAADLLIAQAALENFQTSVLLKELAEILEGEIRKVHKKPWDKQ